MIQTVEQPEDRALVTDGDFELRAYPPPVAGEVTPTGDLRQALRAGFGPLARYIFARDRAGPDIAMTAPVPQSPDEPDRNAWTVRFIMPSGLALAELPEPGSPGGTPGRDPRAPWPPCA